MPNSGQKRKVPWYVTLFAVLAASLGLIAVFLLFSGCAVPREALAFTRDGETYPDTLDGVTVTLDTYMASPPASIANQWLYCELTSTGVASGWGAYSRYTYLENSAGAGSSHPWFWYSNTAKDFQSVSIVPGYNYMGRFGYDGYLAVQAWWGLSSGWTSPTVTFIDDPQSVGLADANLIYAVTNQDFIVYVVNNSDYRTRYDTNSWVTIPVVVNSPAIAWSIPDGNPSCSLSIQYSNSPSQNTYTQIEYYGVCPATGSYIMTQSGRYQLVFTYYIGGVEYHQTWNSGEVTITDPESLSIVSYSVERYTWHHVGVSCVTAHARSVKLQWAYQTNTAYWFDDENQGWTHLNNDTSQWFISFEPASNKVYRIVAFSEDDAQLYVWQDLGDLYVVANPPGDNDGAFGDGSTLESWWTSALSWFNTVWEVFKGFFQPFISVLPPELTQFITLSILMLVVFGLIIRVIR